MPELPDLEVVKESLNRSLIGELVTGVEVRRPLVVRDLVGHPPGAALVGHNVRSVGRWGKFLWLELADDVWLVVNPKLAGRLAWRAPEEKPGAHTALALSLASGIELHYSDAKDMGQVYITPALERVPGFAGQGPDVLDPALTAEVFATRLRKYQGEIKGILTRQEYVAGIGNAYADEILFRAGISPFRRRARLSAGEAERLYRAMREVLLEAVAILRERVGDNIDVEVRDFLQVHRKGGEPCPRCGKPISELHARQRITSFCRQCQPGTLVRN